MSSPVEEGVAVRPFRVDVPEEDLLDLRRQAPEEVLAALTEFLAPYREDGGGLR